MQSIQEDYQKVLDKYSKADYFSKYSCEQADRKKGKLYKYILGIIEKKSCGRLLDVGTGYGYFLNAAQNRGWTVKGIEPSKQSVKTARKARSLDVFYGTLKEYSDEDKFDVITFINVLDHSAQPWKEIERACDLLKPDGLLYLRFPNSSLHARLYKSAIYWGAIDRINKFIVFHQFSFTSKYIRRLLTDAGVIDINVSNSPPTEGDPYHLFSDPFVAQYVKKSVYIVAQFARFFSCRKILLGTSLEVMAVKPKNQ